MFKKFLAFLGLTSVQLTDGKATIEMTEEQIEASGKIIDERDKAIQELESMKKKNQEEQEQNATAQAELAKAQERIAQLEKENGELKKEPGAESLNTTQATDGKNLDAVPTLDSKANFQTNYQKAQEFWGDLM